MDCGDGGGDDDNEYVLDDHSIQALQSHDDYDRVFHGDRVRKVAVEAEFLQQLANLIFFHPFPSLPFRVHHQRVD